VKTVKSNCGPFPAGEEPIQYSGIVSSDSIVSFWIYNSPIWAGITGKPKEFNQYEWVVGRGGTMFQVQGTFIVKPKA